MDDDEVQKGTARLRALYDNDEGDEEDGDDHGGNDTGDADDDDDGDDNGDDDDDVEFSRTRQGWSH